MAHDDGIGHRIAKATGAKAVTVLQSVIAALGSLQPRRIAVFTPYLEDLTAAVARSLTEDGYPAIRAAASPVSWTTSSQLAIYREVLNRLPVRHENWGY